MVSPELGTRGRNYLWCPRNSGTHGVPGTQYEHTFGREFPPLLQEFHGCLPTPGGRSSLKTRSAFITASPDASDGPCSCGVDAYTGKEYSHRKEWIFDRMRGDTRRDAGILGILGHLRYLRADSRRDIGSGWLAVMPIRRIVPAGIAGAADTLMPGTSSARDWTRIACVAGIRGMRTMHANDAGRRRVDTSAGLAQRPSGNPPRPIRNRAANATRDDQYTLHRTPDYRLTPLTTEWEVPKFSFFVADGR